MKVILSRVLENAALKYNALSPASHAGFKEEVMAERINIEQLRKHAPNNPMLAFSPVNTGSPMQDWCAHLAMNPLRRRELEEFAILGDVVHGFRREHGPPSANRGGREAWRPPCRIRAESTD